MAAFESAQHFEQYADEIFDLIEDLSNPADIASRVLDGVESGLESQHNSTSINVSLSTDAGRAGTIDEEFQEPIHILSIAVKDKGDMDDSTMSKVLGSFCVKHKDELEKRRIRRITFIVLKRYVLFVVFYFCTGISNYIDFSKLTILLHLGVTNFQKNRALSTIFLNFSVLVRNLGLINSRINPSREAVGFLRGFWPR